MSPDETLALLLSMAALIENQALLLDALVLQNRQLVAQLQTLEAIRKAQG